MTDDLSSQTAHRASAQEVFGRRAAYYVTSAAHTDQQVLERIVRLSALRTGEEVLDVGTGTGHTALVLAPHAGGVVGLDLTPEMLAEAEALRRQGGLDNVRWVLGDVADLPWDSDSFDVVACRRAAHHFTDMPRAMSEMRRVLRAGGRLVVDDRTVPDDPALDALFNTLDSLHDHSHMREYSPAEWTTFCEGVGLVVDTVEVYIRHRPITSLTEGVAAEDVAEIHRLVETLPPNQAKALHLERRSDAIWFDHHYLLIAAHRPV
jgi:ubiquinone/menaquinone biosynthesis C-methylase UbiE